MFGGLFLGFQMAAQQGYLTVNWKKIEKDVAQGLDIPYNVRPGYFRIQSIYN